MEVALYNMIEQQIRTWEVLDQQILDVIAAIPRADYVPPAYRRLAYADTRIPLDDNQLMMTPKVEARMLQSLRLDSGDRVLEIGTGSGYVTALLAALVRRVVSVELSPTLKHQAAEKLAAQGVNNALLVEGDGVKGWPKEGPYDAIAVTGSLPVVNNELLEQLKVGGRLFAIVGEPPVMEASLITRAGPDDWGTESLFETVIPPLSGAKPPERFEL